MVKTSGCALSARCKPYTNSPETQIDKPKQLGEVFPTSSRQLVVNSTPWRPSTCMLCCLLVCGGYRCDFPVSKFVSHVRFVNMLKIAHKHPQDCWNRYPLLREGLGLDVWISSLGCHLVQVVVMPFSPVLII